MQRAGTQDAMLLFAGGLALGVAVAPIVSSTLRRLWFSFNQKEFNPNAKLMTKEEAPKIDYMVSKSCRLTPELEQLRKETLNKMGRRAGMCSPPDSIAILQMCVRLTKAKKVIEVGVFTGYTSLGMALALPKDGKLIACDVSEEFVAVGKPYWERAGVSNKISLRIQPATTTLEGLLRDGQAGTFDMGFIDADKNNYDAYYELLLKLLRPGGLIVVDNVLWFGKVFDPKVQDVDTQAIRALNDKIYKDDRVDICMLTNSDGITLARKKEV